MANEFIEAKIEAFKNKYPLFKDEPDWKVFTAMCIYYYYYAVSGDAFVEEFVLQSIVDGSDDGGIDAVINDTTSSTNDAIIIQSKYYREAVVTKELIVGELSKINDTIKNLDKFKNEGYKPDMVSAYRNCVHDMEENGCIKVVFFTSYDISNKNTKNSIYKAVKQYFPDFEIELNYLDDIQAQIDLIENSKSVVEEDQLTLDQSNNMLKYDNSIIVNISAKSLQDLYSRRRNGLLGMNLRFHIGAGQKVDAAIQGSIKNDSPNFWYKNNGIVIVCEKYEIIDKNIHLYNFSIVNGGQTTHNIGQSDMPDEDFYIQCKVVKIKGTNDTESQMFASSIAEATNSQKPIKPRDLKANRPEQWRLREKLLKIGFYYMPKNGDKPTPARNYPNPFDYGNLEKVGRVSLAGVLQMPGTSRSNSEKMYNDQYYFTIFGDSVNPQVIADLVKLDYYYDKFARSSRISNYSQHTQAMIKNGRTFCLACLLYAVKLNSGCFSSIEIMEKIEDNEIDELKKTLRKMDNVECVIANKYDNEQEVFEEVFGTIGSEVFGYVFEVASGVAEQAGKTIAASDFLKTDLNYYKLVLKRFNTQYNTKPSFKKIIDQIIVKK